MARDWTLEQRLKRLMLFRVVMITTLLLIAVYVETVSETLLPVNPLYFLIAATYSLTLLYVLGMHFFSHHELQVHVQIVLDLLVITGLVYVTGDTGARAGFIMLYPISVLSASILLYRRSGLTLAGVATVFYAGMLWAVREGWISGRLSDVPIMPLKQVLYSIFVVAVACMTVALIGAFLSESLQTVGRKLEATTEEVADLREFNQVVVKSIHSGLLTADTDGRLVYMNEVGEAILGRRGAELRGRTLRDIFGSVLLEAMSLGARAAGRGLHRLELTYVNPDGQSLELGVSVSVLVTTTGQSRRGYLVAFQNLTEIKRLEREVRIKEKLAAVGEMAAHLAHEIRNPLGSISGSAQVLMSEPNMSGEQARLLAIITRESQRLSDTLNRFLFQARPAPHAAAPVDLERVISEAVTLLRNGSEVQPQHTVHFDADPGPHVCLGDPDQITQVFWNLARNGLEAMPDGGVLEVRLTTEGESLVLSVRDQGRGMGREEQRRMFEPFHSQTPFGVGLGLAIVYQIVRAHHGDIAVRSVPAKGTEVQVRLPRIPVAVPA